MNPELCELLDRGGVISCFLTNSEGKQIDPFAPSSLLCEEIPQPQGREDVPVTLPSREQIILQKVYLRKSGYIVIQVTNELDTCMSEPIPFCQIEQLLLCAPEGTEIDCSITDFRCVASVQCRNNAYQSVQIALDICQSVQSVANTTVNLVGHLCSPRNEITLTQCASPPVNTTKQVLKGDGTSPPSFTDEKEINTANKTTLQQEEIYVNTRRVVDWVVQQSTIKLYKNADKIAFVCDICTINLLVPAVTCENTITGSVECDGEPVAGASVIFTAAPDIVDITPNPATSDEFGQFETVVTVPEGTASTDITVTASTVINDQEISSTATTTVQC
ncbi:carboxypeptidase-like regulatory domain-containing protein [Gracilibacillus lacisalsi]|uniref:carboxypeptidase-like regulatory domain-containing protein n=1 Tax=Gracilibacillus lacisalsi TaxID=393087 RepID=UPI00036790D7|nr:carboxypeptidase-like regulatory domain-containing protein [Gracilibacillus lacisalsi]